MNKVLAISGFIVLGLSPSFIDWGQAGSSERKMIVVYYSIAALLIYAGLWGYDA